MFRAHGGSLQRAYRIGQDKPVFVHKLLCQDTVEERIHKLQQDKAKLAAGLLADADISNKLDAAWSGRCWRGEMAVAWKSLDFRNRNFRKMVICNRFENLVIVLSPKRSFVIVLAES